MAVVSSSRVARVLDDLVVRATTSVSARRKATLAPQPQPILKEQPEQSQPGASKHLLGQLQAHEIRIPVPWGHIAGKWWGPRDRRPVIALHGWGDNAGSFERLATSLRGVPILALDWPGHGFSSHVPRGVLPADRGLLMHTLRRVQRALGLPAMSLVGHSLGDAAALLYAATFPSEVDLYVSLDTLAPAPFDAEGAVKAGGQMVDDLLECEEALDKHSDPVSRNDLLDALLVTKGGSVNRHAAETLLLRGLVEGCTEGRYTPTLDPRLSGGRRLPILSHALALAAARNIRCPVLAVIPQWQATKALSADPQLREDSLEAIRMASKSLTVVRVDGTHHVHLNNPELVTPALQEFIDHHRKNDEKIKIPNFRA